MPIAGRLRGTPPFAPYPMAFRAGSVGPSAPAQQRVRYVRPELRLLERHTHRSGRDTVDHGRIGSDDFANSCCGVLRNLSNYLEY